MSIQTSVRQDLITAGLHSLSAGADFDPETAADLGFTTPDNMEDQIATAELGIAQRQGSAQQIGMFVCGDCCTVDCSHYSISKNGKLSHNY